MKLLAPLLRPQQTETRYTTDDYVNWVNQSMGWGSFGFQGSQYPLGVNLSVPGSKSEPIEPNLQGLVAHGLKGNGVVWTCMAVRLEVFAQAQFKFQKFNEGKPGRLFGTNALAPLEVPWPGGTTGQLLARMITDVDIAGNFYGARTDDGIVRLRPDWVDIALEPLTVAGGRVGFKRVGYLYYDGGKRDGVPTVILPDEMCHFAPKPDPVASYRGMTWLTPIVREVMGDTAYARHKVAFVDNAATPNLAVSLPKEMPLTNDQFIAWVDTMKKQESQTQRGPQNAGKTLYTANGADVTVVGADMKQLDFKVVQGAGETRIAAASGVGAVIAQFSEGLQGSSLNAGNYGASRRRFGDVPMRFLWQEVCGALSPLVAVPRGSRLWYLGDIPFLQEDAMDAAEIMSRKMLTVESGIRAGYTPDSITAAVDAEDVTLLEHTGLFSVQLQPPGIETPPSTPVEEDVTNGE
jgi:hypothetical protein